MRKVKLLMLTLLLIFTSLNFPKAADTYTLKVHTGIGVGKITVNYTDGDGTSRSATTGTSGTVTISSVKANTTVKLTAGSFSTGYVFKRWYSGSSTLSTSNPYSFTMNANKDLLGEGTPASYKVSYNANGGSSKPSDQTATYGSTITLASAIKHAGKKDTLTHTFDANGGTASATSVKTTKTTPYTFKKWAAGSASSSTTYSAGASYTVKKNVTMYATWTAGTPTYSALGTLPTATRKVTNNAAEVTVTLNPNGGTVSPTKVTGTATRVATFPFEGWYTAKSGGDKISAETKPTKATTYYAHWGDADVTASNFSAISLPTPTRSGYKFDGWYTAASGGSKVSNPYTPTKTSVTLYAHWTANYPTTTYTVSYDANGGTGAPAAQTKNPGQTLTLSSTKPTWASTTTDGYVVTLNANGGSVSTTKLTAKNTTSHTFNKWNTKKDGSGTSYNPGGSYTADANATLYAQWTTKTTNGSVDLPTPTRSGYTFKGWGTSASATSGSTGSYTPTGNVTLYAIWVKNSDPTPTTYTVKFNANGGSAVSSITVQAGGTISKIPTTTRKGYIFKGWWNGNTQLTTSTKINSDITFTAKWAEDTSQNTYTVKFDGNGGTSPSSIKVKHGSTVGKLPSSTRSGYTFQGWWTAKSGGSKISSSTRIYKNTTFYAHWTKNSSSDDSTLTIKFDGNGGTNPDDLVIDKGEALGELPDSERAGYRLVGWFTAAEAGEQVTAETKPAKSTTYYAHWEEADETKIIGVEVICDQPISFRLVNENGEPVELVQNNDNIVYLYELDPLYCEVTEVPEGYEKPERVLVDTSSASRIDEEEIGTEEARALVRITLEKSEGNCEEELAALKAYYESLDESDFSPQNWEKVQKLYEEALREIETTCGVGDTMKIVTDFVAAVGRLRGHWWHWVILILAILTAIIYVIHRRRLWGIIVAAIALVLDILIIIIFDSCILSFIFTALHVILHVILLIFVKKDDDDDEDKSPKQVYYTN